MIGGKWGRSCPASPISTAATSLSCFPTPKVHFPGEKTRGPCDAAKLQAGNFGDGNLILRSGGGAGAAPADFLAGARKSFALVTVQDPKMISHHAVNCGYIAGMPKHIIAQPSLRHTNPVRLNADDATRKAYAPVLKASHF